MNTQADGGESGSRGRKAGTRRQLLDAAAQVVAEKGFAGASLADIADRAQLTTGAVYSNFRSKEALLLALVGAQLDRMDSRPPASAEEILEAAREAGSLSRDPGLEDEFRAQVEVYLLGLRDPAVRGELQRRESAITDAMAQVLGRIEALDFDPPTPTLNQLAEVFFATLQGLQQHRLMFPEALPVSVFEWWAATVLKAARDAQPGQS